MQQLFEACASLRLAVRRERERAKRVERHDQTPDTPLPRARHRALQARSARRRVNGTDSECASPHRRSQCRELEKAFRPTSASPEHVGVTCSGPRRARRTYRRPCEHQIGHLEEPGCAPSTPCSVSCRPQRDCPLSRASNVESKFELNRLRGLGECHFPCHTLCFNQQLLKSNLCLSQPYNSVSDGIFRRRNFLMQ